MTLAESREGRGVVCRKSEQAGESFIDIEVCSPSEIGGGVFRPKSGVGME